MSTNTEQIGIGDLEVRLREDVLEEKFPGTRDHLADSWDQVDRTEREGPPAKKEREKYCKFCAARITLSPDMEREYGHIRRFERKKWNFYWDECPFAMKNGGDGNARW